jgi:hypothetical protein
MVGMESLLNVLKNLETGQSNLIIANMEILKLSLHYLKIMNL